MNTTRRPSIVRMVRFRMVLGVVVAAFAFSAGMASSAQAFQWEIEETTLKGEESVLPGISPSLTLRTKVLGSPLVLNMSFLESSDLKIASGGTGSGHLRFTGTVSEPVGCILTPFETKALKLSVVEVTGVPFVKFVPAEGETIANLTLSKCATAGTYPLKGSFYGETWPLEWEFVVYPLTFTAFNFGWTGESMVVGKEKARFEGGMTMQLWGANVNRYFAPSP